MRILKPEIAKERKEKILNWLIYRYIATGKPVSSNDIFNSKIFSISPASIRNILKELDDEGYLSQVHTSGGRVPTDKAYRFYIDSILKMQNLAEVEKEKIEIEYDRKIAELDYFLKHTTKMISQLTKKVSFSMVSDITQEYIKRVDIVHVSKNNYLFIIVTVSGLIRHFPFTLSKKMEYSKLRTTISTLNRRFNGLKISDAKDIISKDFIPKGEEVFYAIYDILVNILKENDNLFIEGLTKIYEEDDDFSIEELRNMTRLIEEKEKFTQILKQRLVESFEKAKQCENKGQGFKKHIIDVKIGRENKIKELDNFSIVTSAYCVNDKSYGLIGIIGQRRMEYPKVISIIDSVSSILEEIIEKWEKDLEF